MITPHLKEHLQRNAGLLLALLGCVAACLLLGTEKAQPETQEDRIARVLSSMMGAGETEVCVYYDAQSVPCGAVVLSHGAGNVAVRLQLSHAVSTLLGLDPSDVAVYPLQGGSP